MCGASAEIPMFEQARTIIVASPIPIPLRAEVEVASVGHIPRTSTNVGLFFMIPCNVNLNLFMIIYFLFPTVFSPFAALAAGFVAVAAVVAATVESAATADESAGAAWSAEAELSEFILLNISAACCIASQNALDEIVEAVIASISPPSFLTAILTLPFIRFKPFHCLMKG